MGLGKALQKLFHGGHQDKEAEEERGRAAHHVRSQSALSWRQLRNRCRGRSATPGIPILNIDKLLSRESRKFDNAITKESLSHIMLWYLYWDIVEMSDDPDRWYGDFGDREEMISWIRLGFELDQHALHLPRVLRGVCRDLNIDGSEVQRRLIRLSKPSIMVKTEIAEWGMAVIVGAEYYTKKLRRDRELVIALRPEPNPQWLIRQKQIIAGIDFFLDNLFVPTTAPSDLIGAQLRNQAHVNWGRQGGPRPRPPEILYERALPRAAFLGDSGTMLESQCPSSQRRRSKSTLRRPSVNGFDDEHPPVPGNGNLQTLSEERRRSTASLDDLTSFANRMNAQMTNQMDALAGTLTDRLAQLREDIMRYLRDQEHPIDETAAVEYGEQIHSSGPANVLDSLEPQRERPRQIEQPEDPIDVRSHLHYRGRLSQAARKRNAKFEDVQSTSPLIQKFNGHHSFLDFPPPPVPASHHRRNCSTDVDIQTRGSAIGSFNPYSSTVTNGYSKSQAHTAAFRNVSPSQYSPTSESGFEQGPAALGRSSRILPRRPRREEYQIIHPETEASGTVAEGNWTYGQAQPPRATNGPSRHINGNQPHSRANPTQMQRQTQPKGPGPEPFPEFDLSLEDSYPDCGNPFTNNSPETASNGSQNGNRNSMEAGSSYSWRSPRGSPRETPRAPASYVSTNSAEEKIDSANDEEKFPPLSSSQVASTVEHFSRGYDLMRATREAIEADQRYNEIEEEIKGSKS